MWWLVFSVNCIYHYPRDTSLDIFVMLFPGGFTRGRKGSLWMLVASSDRLRSKTEWTERYLDSWALILISPWVQMQCNCLPPACVTGQDRTHPQLWTSCEPSSLSCFCQVFGQSNKKNKSNNLIFKADGIERHNFENQTRPLWWTCVVQK